MLDQIKSALKNPEFQRKAAHTAGSIVSFVATIVISNVVDKAIGAGVDAVMDKIQGKTEEAPAE